jgi:hypothetical protein
MSPMHNGPFVRVLLSSVAIIGAGLSPTVARGAVNQPTGEAMPQPTGAAEIAVVTSRGFPANAVTLAGLFFYQNEMIDPVMDAYSTPGTFSPQCGFTGQLLLRGGSCKLPFGWYNVTPGSTTPPPANQIYPLVPADPRAPPPQGLMCADQDFCPLATMMTTQAPQHSWIPETFSAANIRMDPHYTGGLIGFAIVGDPTSQCSQTKYSQAELNTRQVTTGMPWITTLVWQSTVDPDAYYIGFEDLPLSPMTWRGFNNGVDGDFNDFVYKITGVSCEGGGKPCETGMPGVCASGTTQCSAGEAVVCKPDVAATAEVCDGLDNNCDGMIDEGNPCSVTNQICDKGVCVNPCNSGEFPCLAGFVCDQGLCKDPTCLGVTCPAGQICNRGVCVGGCDGVVCPTGQICRIGRCVDPCAGVTCADGTVCENGACLPNCGCRNCGAGTTCATATGHCVDSGCETQTCTSGQVCVGGQCQDPCTGARCPVNQECKLGGGGCQDLPAPVGTGGSPFLLRDGGDSGTGGFSGLGATFGGVGSGGGATGAGEASSGPAPIARACGCAMPGGRGGRVEAAWASALTAVLAGWVARRRRARR